MLTNEEQKELDMIKDILANRPLDFMTNDKDRKIELENKAMVGQYKDFYIETAKDAFVDLVHRYKHNSDMLKFELEQFLKKYDAIKKEQLTFVALRKANEATVGQFKNKRGEGFKTLHRPEWDLNAWVVNLVGEVGKVAKISTNINRGNYNMAEAKWALADEIADAQIALDLLADHIGIDLADATREKFNNTMEKLGINIKL